MTACELARCFSALFEPGQFSSPRLCVFALLPRVSFVQPAVQAAVNGTPATIAERTVRISIPARATTQSGTFNNRTWQVTWDTQERWENPLMGWISRYVVPMPCSWRPTWPSTIRGGETKRQGLKKDTVKNLDSALEGSHALFVFLMLAFLWLALAARIPCPT